MASINRMVETQTELEGLGGGSGGYTVVSPEFLQVKSSMTVNHIAQNHLIAKMSLIHRSRVPTAVLCSLCS
jgi:hypothetical protein